MFKKLLENLKKFFTGGYIEDELTAFVNSHNPATIEDVEHLEKVFWRKKSRTYGYY